MIIEHLLDDNNLTNTEKSIAQFLLNKDQKINNLTSSELGKQSYTSQAAVTRLYKKLGFNNFREFLSTLILERNDYLKYNDLPTEHPEQYFTSLEDTEKVIASLYEKAMIQTNRLLDKNVVNRVCNRILSASFIDIYGIGLSDTIAKEMCFKLQSLGLPCSYQNGINIKYIDNIVRNQKITRVPKTQTYYKGVINLRGEIIPVMSIRLKLGLEDDEFTDKTRIIIVKIEGATIGVIVDQVREVVTLDDDNTEKITRTSRDDAASGYISSIGKSKGELISLLDIVGLIVEN